MRSITLASTALLAAILCSGCIDADCSDNVVEMNVGSGSYGLADAEGSRLFPHEGRDVSIDVDRKAGLVHATWRDDAGREVVETWRIVR